MKTIILLILLIINPVSWASPVVESQIVFYDVWGLTSQAIRSSINNRSPIREGSTNYAGYTQWHVNWSYKWRENGSKCFVIQSNTNIKIKITMPNWQNSKTADNALKNRWQTFERALFLHEKGHEAITIKAANEIETAILTMPSMANCSALEQAANRLGHAILEQARIKQKQYDLDTNHGEKTGAARRNI
jgi:predicted secreted Zn-dependent protease